MIRPLALVRAPLLPNRQQIETLASDAGSLKRARGTAKRSKWQALGRSADAVWGECRGSATYRVKTELSTLTLTCSCPSRVRPCKHSLAMMLLAVDQPDAFPQGANPDWVQEWLDQRQKRRDAREAKAAEPKKAPDPEAAARRVAAREAKVAQGLQAHRRWMEDLVTQGLASLELKGPGFFDAQAARLADAQCGGLRRWVMRLGDEVGVGEDWPQRVLAELGRMALLMQAYQRQPHLPPDLVHDVRRAVGWAPSKADVLEHGEHLRDRWLVAHQVIREEDERLHSRTTRLLGLDSGRWALVLEYAPMAPRFDLALPTGQVLDMEVAFYPSAAPERALPVSTFSVGPLLERPNGGAVADALDSLARVLAVQPWRRSVPTVLTDVQLVTQPWAVVDAKGHALPLSAPAWGLLAASGGRPLDVLGTIQSGRFHLHAVWTGDALVQR